MSDTNSSPEPTGEGAFKQASSTLDPLLARLEFDGVIVEAEVTETTDSGIALQLPRGAGRLLPLSGKLLIELEGGALSEPLRVEGHAVSWQETPEMDNVRVDIDETNLSAVQWALRNQRGIRVPIRGERAVRARIDCTADEISFDAAIINVSGSGIAVVVAPADDRRLAATRREASNTEPWLVEVSIQLPGNRMPMRHIAAVRNRTFTRQCIKYGIEFDLERTAAAFPKQVDTAWGQLLRFQQSLLEAG